MRFLKKMLHKAKSALHDFKSKFDRNGSYTGTAEKENGTASPEQDADDL